MSLKGQVKSFNPGKGFGFIIGADGSDVFVHIKACADGGVPQQGDTLSYEIQPSQIKPGQMQACNVTGGTGKPTEKGGGKGCGKGGGGGTGAHTGSIKSFNAKNGFGFIVGPDGSDVFLHIKACVDGGTPQQGDVMTYDMEPSKSKPGQMVASNAAGGTGYAQGGGKGNQFGIPAAFAGGGGGGGFGGKSDGWGGGKGDSWGGGKSDGWGGGKGDMWGGGGKGGDMWGGGGGGGGFGGKGDAWGKSGPYDNSFGGAYGCGGFGGKMGGGGGCGGGFGGGDWGKGGGW